MYLKSIEVHGFKSFANKINFNFHNGITGIVGPNGSGKSNVADAVRWVLGEQRAKQLRGSNMQDVIFSGTELRKPMGYAYVSITLDNSDHALSIGFDEVTVSRRVYRSGESEYLINGVPSRLKDINELFYDTGIGKEGYSIIGQGQIDKILSGKPEERRELFDEAAGIVKFKRRKDAAAKKLENERNNLVRITDILSELEKQVEPLEKQSEVAKEYLKYKEELKNYDVNLFLLESENVKLALEELTRNLDVATDDLNDTNRELEKIKRNYSDIEAKLEELDQSIEDKRQKLSDNDIMREKLEGEIKVLEEKINSSKINAGHFEEREADLKSQLDKKTEEYNVVKAEKDEIDKEIADISKRRDEEGAKLSDIQKRIEELSKGIDDGNNELINTINSRGSITTKLGQFETMLSQMNIRKAEIQSRLLKAKSEESEQDKLLKEYTETLNNISTEILENDKLTEHMSEQLYLIRRELEEKDNILVETKNNLNKKQSQLEALKSIAERYEGYGHAVKSIMEKKDENKGLIGVVADIISAEKKFETALETALGGNIQNIVTEDEVVAKKMIAFIKEKKLGRATFLPLTTVRPRGEYKFKEIKNEQGFLGLATEIAIADKKYNDIVSQLLGEIAIVDNVDNALKIAKKFEYKLRLVTLEGEYIQPGGVLSGGSYKNNSNLLGRKREIEELEKTCKEYESKIEEIVSDIADTKKKRDKFKDDIENLKEHQQELNIKQNTAQINVDKATEKINEIKDGYKELEAENSRIEIQVNELKADKNNATTELTASETKEKETEQLIAKLGQELEKLRDEESRQVLCTTDLGIEFANINQKLDFSKQNLDRIGDEIDRLNIDMKDLVEKKNSADDDVKEKLENIEAIKNTIEASISSKTADKEALEAAITEKEEFQAKQKSFFETREKLSEKSSSLDKEVYRLSSQKEKLEESQRSLVGYMFNEYELTLSQAAQFRDESLTDTSLIRKNISVTKDAIKKLGDVNVNAIEDYKNLMERYTFLKEQHDDIVKAEQSLVDIIEELDQSMRKQFVEKFTDINREYDKVFKEMFGGGKGTLELEEDVDVLEAGIKIIAQPPGKKLQNMMQLSGGEKALTAIALLFAIQNLKPSPFCLLDEIEAALDESNVSRFAGYLHKLTKHTQFIVITHRRGTMEQADRLYGITMQEKGVSALVSVNLIDKDLDE